MNLNCVITDDEPVALEILADYIAMVPGLELVANCRNAMETWSALRLHRVDILFMDIKMPGINGLDFVRSLRNRPAIIFTTAFPQYAIEGFDLDVLDYLLKPISIDRFLKAVYKAFDKSGIQKAVGYEKTEPISNSFLFIKSDKGLIKIEFCDILFIEALENYVSIHTRDKTLLTLSTMKAIEESLPPMIFLRVHRSYIINLKNVDSLQGNNIKIGTQNLIVGRSFRKTVSEIFKKYQL
jgi:two-component system, LytTR family, response regulator